MSLATVVAPCALAADTDKEESSPKQTSRTEIDAFPIAGGNSDVGFGGGVVGQVTRHVPGASPYLFRAELTAMTMVKPPLDVLRFPYQDYAVTFTLPDLSGGRLRLEVRPSYTREERVLYAGVGNARRVRSGAPETSEYGRVHPTLSVGARLDLGHSVYLRVGQRYTHNVLMVHRASRLDADLRSDDPHLRELLGATEAHGVYLFELRGEYDTHGERRGQGGQHHHLEMRLSPGSIGHLPYRYGQANGTMRFYVAPHGRRLVLASRVVADFLFGRPPFYELARYEETQAIGGVNGVRGVPGGLYSGKIKLIGNLEARSELVRFELFGKRFGFGGAVFVDGGRLWADYGVYPELDGTGIGLKYGLGGGLRISQRDTFVIRLDVAWSPDADPVGAYFAVGEMF